MTTYSKSCMTHSLPEAKRMVDQLKAARFSPDEISMLVSRSNPGADAPPVDPATEREKDVSDIGENDILVSVHLEGGCGMSRAEEIFGRAGLNVPPPVQVEDESPHSWTKPLFTRSRR